jgi:hypothetical protein
LYGYIEQGPSTISMSNPGDNGAPADPVNRLAFGYILNLPCVCLLFKFYLSLNLNTCTCFALTRSLITVMNLLIISGIKMYRKLPIYLTPSTGCEKTAAARVHVSYELVMLVMHLVVRSSELIRALPTQTLSI